jgi:hypothetical protein
MAHLLNTALVVANNGLKQLNSATDRCIVRRACAPIAAFCFVASDSCFFYSR